MATSNYKTNKDIFLRNSRFTRLLRKEDKACIFHSLFLTKVYGNEILEDIFNAFKNYTSTSEVITNLSSGYTYDLVNSIVSDLQEKGLLIQDDQKDTEDYLNLFNQGLHQYTIQHIYFISTTGCNLRCKYCFIEDEDNRPFKPRYMTKATAKKGLELFAKLSQNAPNRISMTYYGGEPLLNAKVVYYAMDYVRELEKKGLFSKSVDMQLLTNGSLVDEKTIDTVRRNKVNVSVSIDGPEHLHDLGRIDVKGNITFKEALAGFRKFQEAGLNPGISCTLTRFNIDHIVEVVEFIANELKPSGMGFNVLLPRYDAKNPVDVPHEFSAAKLIEAFKILREYGIYEDRVMRRVRPYTESYFHMKDCMGVGGQFVIAPDGSIGPCQALLGFDDYFPLQVKNLHSDLDNATSDTIYQDSLFNEWRHRFPLNMKECMDCEAISICGGGCPYASLVTDGSIWEVDNRVCSQSKQILEWMLWDTFEHLQESDKKESEVSV